MRDAVTAVVQDTPYSISLQRTLRAAMALDERTKLDIIFKKAGRSGLDLYVNKTAAKLELFVHERLLNFDASHNEDSTECGLARTRSVEKSVDSFSCDHIILDLYDQILDELERVTTVTSSGDEIYTSAKTLRLRLSECLRNMPRMVEVAQGSREGELRVSWVDTEGDRALRLHGLELQCRVKLHRELTCIHKRYDLLTPPGKFTTTRFSQASIA